MKRRRKRRRRRYWSYQELIYTIQRHFIEYGYRLTHLEDISMEAEVPKGTIYLYAQNKEALFYLALRWADKCFIARPHRVRPVPQPPKDAIQRYVLKRLEEVRGIPNLKADPPARSLDQARAEFRAALTEIYGTLFTNQTAIRLIQRCSHEHPSLRDLFLTPRKKPAVAQITRFLEVHREFLAHDAQPEILARVSYSTVAFLAVYRKWSPGELMIRRKRAIRDTLLNALVDGLLAKRELPPATVPETDD